MGLRAAEWAVSVPLSVLPRASTRAVLALLAIRSTDPGCAAYPSVSTMADTLETTRRTVQRGLRELLDAGLIRPGDQDAVRSWRADRRPVVYDVCTPELLAAEERTASRWIA